MKSLENFLLEATGEGANEIDKIEFCHSKLDSLERTVIDLAIEDAINTANQISKKMNIKIGKPIVISNVEPVKFTYDNIVELNWIKSGSPEFMKGAALGGGGHVRKVLMEINPGLIKINNKVYVTFKILEK